MQIVVIIILAIIYATFMILSERAKRRILKDWGESISLNRDLYNQNSELLEQNVELQSLCTDLTTQVSAHLLIEASYEAKLKELREEIERYRSLENVKVYDDLRVKYNQLRDCCKNLQRQIRDETYGTVAVTGPLSTDVIRND